MHQPESLDISVFGLGYVGTVMAACLTRDGHRVVGVDVSASKVQRLQAGLPPIIEAGLAELLESAVQQGRLSATGDAVTAVNETEISVVCVGTPPLPAGGTDLAYVFRVCGEIARAVARKAQSHVVIIRSTIPPGTLARCADIFRGAGAERWVHLAFNPEFLREGSAISDYDTPPYTVVGALDEDAVEAVRRMYARIPAPVVMVRPGTAELVKFVANAWHATKIAFANEVGRLAKGCSLDGAEVMNLIARDTKLNVSTAYMRPGGAYGGSCLPKDLGALIAIARERSVAVPLLESVPDSNRVQIESSVAQVMGLKCRSVALFGLAFKSGTDDLRESPAVPLVKRLLGEGLRVSIFDAAVQQATLMGTNLAYVREHLPHFEALLMPTAQEAARSAEAIVVTQRDADLLAAAVAVADGRRVLDLSRAVADGSCTDGTAPGELRRERPTTALAEPALLQPA